MARKKPANSLASSKSGALPLKFFHTCPKALPPIRAAPKPKSMANNTLSSLSCNSGVTVLRTSCTGANAEIISDKGEITAFCVSPSCQTVFMDNESLPTGMLKPKFWHNSETAATVRYSFSSSPAVPQGAIQLADNLILPISPMAAEAILVMASPTHILPEAGALNSAKVGFSPMLMASPK